MNPLYIDIERYEELPIPLSWVTFDEFHYLDTIFDDKEKRLEAQKVCFLEYGVIDIKKNYSQGNIAFFFAHEEDKLKFQLKYC